jgi:glycosyltransferase involved in cell wall biosynthesis
MKAHLRLYDVAERLVCRGGLVFAQGESCYRKHAGAADAHLVMSASHRETDVRPPRDCFRERPFRILHVGRLESVKNQGLLLQALALLGAGWHLTIVGDGPRRSELVNLAGALGVSDQVSFPGLVRHGPALWEYFDGADVFALSSRSEGTPKVLLEAMARGVPVVATRVSGVPTLVDHEMTGLLYADNDVHGLVAALKRFSADFDLRQSIVNRASEFASAHTVERETARMMNEVFRKWPHLARGSL